MEAVELRQGWSVAKNKGDVRKKGRRPRKVVKKTTKEGGLSPQEGDARRFKKK